MARRPLGWDRSRNRGEYVPSRESSVHKVGDTVDPVSPTRLHFRRSGNWAKHSRKLRSLKVGDVDGRRLRPAGDHDRKKGNAGKKSPHARLTRVIAENGNC